MLYGMRMGPEPSHVIAQLLICRGTPAEVRVTLSPARRTCGCRTEPPFCYDVTLGTDNHSSEPGGDSPQLGHYMHALAHQPLSGVQQQQVDEGRLDLNLDPAS